MTHHEIPQLQSRYCWVCEFFGLRHHLRMVPKLVHSNFVLIRLTTLVFPYVSATCNPVSPSWSMAIRSSLKRSAFSVIISRMSIQYKNKEPALIAHFNSNKLFLQDKKTYMLPPPGGFFQATKLAEKIIIDEILLYFNETKQLKILDLFSGCGTLSLPLLNKQHYGYALE